MTHSYRELADLAFRAYPDDEREVEAFIHCRHKGIEFVLIATGDEAYGDICDPLDSGYGTGNRTTRGYLYARYPEDKRGALGGGKLGNRVQGCSGWPAYLLSVDAARKLWPKGWVIRVTEVRFGAWLVEGWLGDKSTRSKPDVSVTDVGEAKARTVAALEALGRIEQMA